jgi:hypothetical protein
MVRMRIVSAMSIACSVLFGSAAIALDGGSVMSPRIGLLQTVQQDGCPAGYPWMRNSTNTCYSSEADCRDTNGGGWSCHQVNQC